MNDLHNLERQLEAATDERWWSVDEADKWTIAIFGPKATFIDWGMLTSAFKSLDVAIALCERVLPGWDIAIDSSPSERTNKAKRLWDVAIYSGTPRLCSHAGNLSSPALALCLAVVRALIAKETTK